MTKRVSPLRQRMIDDMTIRNMSANTQEVYIRAVVGLSALHGRSPDKLALEDVRDYQLHLVARGLKPASINIYMSGLRFFYATTLGQRYLACQIPMARTQDPLPTVLSPGEVERFLKAVKTMKMRAAFMTIYGAGLACVGTHSAYRQRHRQRAHGHQCAASQGRQGSPHHAFQPATEHSPRLLEANPTIPLAFPRR
jgi:site-specific recombinase XerD